MKALPIQAREQERPAAGFGLNPDLDVEGLAAAYAATGRIRIHRFLAEQGLPEFYDNLCERDDWWHLMNGPDGIVEIDRATRAGMSEADRRRLDDMAQRVWRVVVAQYHLRPRGPEVETEVQPAAL